MREEVSASIIIKDYPSLGPNEMSRIYHKPVRYFIRRANILSVKWNRPERKDFVILAGLI